MTAVGPWLLAIDGIDGSGKSSFAERLMAALAGAGIAGALLRVDDFRQPVEWHRAGRTEADAYHDDYYELGRLDAAADALLGGAPAVAVPVFDAAAGRRVGERSVALAAGQPRAVVVEGVFTLRAPAVRARASLVYLRTSFEEARRRILARDTARGRTPEDVSHRIDRRYFPAQERYIRDHTPAARADVLVDHERAGHPSVVRFDASRLPGAVEAAVRQALADFAVSAAVK